MATKEDKVKAEYWPKRLTISTFQGFGSGHFALSWIVQDEAGARTIPSRQAG